MVKSTNVVVVTMVKVVKTANININFSVDKSSYFLMRGFFLFNILEF